MINKSLITRVPLKMRVLLSLVFSQAKYKERTMASSAKDIHLRELKDTITQLKTMVSEQTELIRSLRLVIDEKTSHKKPFRNRWTILPKSFSVPPAKKEPMIFRGSSTFLMKRKWNRIFSCWKKRQWSGSIPARRKQPMRTFLKA